MPAKNAYYIAEPLISPALAAVAKFDSSQIVAVQYPSGNFELDRMIEFWTLMKIPTRDNENGPGQLGTLSWVYSHSHLFKENGLYQLYAFLYEPTGELVAVGGVVDEDRNVLRDKGLIANGLWGYFNVDHRLRNKGLGTIVTNFVDGEVHRYADRTGTPLTKYLFTGEPSAMHLYEGLGWTTSGASVSVPDFAGVEGLPPEEVLYKKVYLPGDGTAAKRITLTTYAEYLTTLTDV